VADQDLIVSEGDLAELAGELHGMRDHLDKQVRRLNSMVESVIVQGSGEDRRRGDARDGDHAR
jgi:hypothetical protein